MAWTTLAFSVFCLCATALECSVRDLASHVPSNAQVVNATHVPANGTYGEGAIDLEFPGLATGLPELCAVTVLVQSSPTSNYRFGLFLPAEWNERYIATGNGGFGGGINWVGLGTFTRYGFAAMSTDTGHNSSTFDGRWAVNDTEAQVDWGYRALHGSVEMSKQLVDAFYGRDHKFSYYSGCSTGGRQGMKEVQMFPDDFDGVLAGAPAWWTTHMQAWNIHVALYNLPEDKPGHVPHDLMVGIVHDEILRQCDPQDGVRDDIISRPYSCDMNFNTIQCSPESGNSSCLTSAQISTLHKLYSPWVEADQTFVFPSLAFGSEDESGLLFVDAPPPPAAGTTYVGPFLYNTSDYDWSSFSYEVVQYADSLNPGDANANETDISPFYDKGGKLISYHGYADGLIPSGSSLYLYDLYDRAMRGRGISLDDFYRLYMVPGMQHCSGGIHNAPWTFGADGQAEALSPTAYSVPGFEDAEHDVLLALMQWVEEGQAPGSIVATKFADDSADGEVVRQRPLCPHPKVAKLQEGAADPDIASSWYCAYLHGDEE